MVKNLENEIPLVSVLIPAYNSEDTIEECILSVTHQTYGNIEIVIIDDGSKDNTPQICDAFAEKDDRIRVIHTENGGVGRARNISLNEACGKYILFLDSDDSLKPDEVALLLREAESKNLQLICYSGEVVWNDIQTKEGLEKNYDQTVQNYIIKNGIDCMFEAVKAGEYNTSTAMRLYRLDYLNDNGFRFDEGIIHEDEAIGFLAYISAERMECISDRLYYRTYHPGSIMTSRTCLNSAKGYTVAMNRLSDAFLNRSEAHLSEKEKALFIRRIELYKKLIAICAAKILKSDKKLYERLHDFREISSMVRPALKKAKKIDKGILSSSILIEAFNEKMHIKKSEW